MRKSLLQYWGCTLKHVKLSVFEVVTAMRGTDEIVLHGYIFIPAAV
jgi:hypothetical protein